MESILRIRDKDGNIVDIPALQGADGLSAYQIAIKHGFEGSEEDWLESLKCVGGSSERPTAEVILPSAYLEYNDNTSAVWDYDVVISDDMLNKEIAKIEYQKDGNWTDLELLLEASAYSPIIRTNKTMFFDNDMSVSVAVVLYCMGQIPNWWVAPNELGQLKITYYTD